MSNFIVFEKLLFYKWLKSLFSISMCVYYVTLYMVNKRRNIVLYFFISSSIWHFSILLINCTIFNTRWQYSRQMRFGYGITVIMMQIVMCWMNELINSTIDVQWTSRQFIDYQWTNRIRRQLLLDCKIFIAPGNTTMQRRVDVVN